MLQCYSRSNLRITQFIYDKTNWKTDISILDKKNYHLIVNNKTEFYQFHFITPYNSRPFQIESMHFH